MTQDLKQGYRDLLGSIAEGSVLAVVLQGRKEMGFRFYYWLQNSNI